MTFSFAYRLIFALLTMTAFGIEDYTAEAAEPWTRLYVGQIAILGGGSLYYPTKLCETADEVDDYELHHGPDCKIKVPYGARVRVIAMQSAEAGPRLAGRPNLNVEVESVEQGWSGWVSSFWIVPAIPTGTVLTINIDPDDDPAALFTKLSPGAEANIPLGRHATVRVLGQLGGLCDVRVLSGPKPGSRGFLDCLRFGTTNLAPDGIHFEM